MRKELTDEWHRSGIHDPKDFAILTNVLTKAWSGMTTGEYKRYKIVPRNQLLFLTVVFLLDTFFVYL